MCERVKEGVGGSDWVWGYGWAHGGMGGRVGVQEEAWVRMCDVEIEGTRGWSNYFSYWTIGEECFL